MGINITHTMGSFQFENKENLRNAAKNILNKQGSDSQTTQKIIEQTIFDGQTYVNPQLSILKASTQISVNNTLKETLKYLQKQAAKKAPKEPVLGEIWNLFNDTENETPYTGELLDFQIDSSIKNIFAA